MVASASEREKLKQEFLELLKSDEEFRLAVAGLLGLDTILSELKRLWESVEKLRIDFLTFAKEQEKRWEENNKRWEENERRWRENEKMWEEAFKRFEAIEKTLAEHSNILREHSMRFDRIEERLMEHDKSLARLEVVLGHFGGRWGRSMERMVLEIFREVLEERGIEPGKVEKFEYIDSDGRYYKKGSRIEVDIYVHDNKLYLIEVKALAEYEDVEHFHDIAQVVEKILGRKTDKLILIAVDIFEDALKRAEELGIDVIYGALIPSK
jgi:hypothetical protein